MGRPTLTSSATIAPGKLITLEGGEGTGKSTQAARLVASLRRIGLSVQGTREPGGSSGAEQIRRLLLEGGIERWDSTSEALLFFAARRDHLVRTIRPAIDVGRWVICDRFTDSTIAYQGYGRGFPLDDLRLLSRISIGSYVPDLTLVLDMAVDLGLGRVGRRSMIMDRFENLQHEFHQRLRDGFLAIAKAEPERCVVIDASADIDAVHRAILAAVSSRLGVEFHE